MKTNWNTPYRVPRERALREFRHQTLHLPFYRRIDIVLLIGLALAGLLLCIIWVIPVAIGLIFGTFDDPVLQKLPDDRILDNVRNGHDLLDAVVRSPQEDIVISSSGGTIHFYDPQTGLWKTERPFKAGDPIDRNFTMLRSGCGADLQALRAGDCPDSGSLWAVGADGSLARRRSSGQWEIVIGDVAFVGLNGRPVQSSELTSAAVSDNNEWLIVGTQANGLGIYHIPRRTWITQGEANVNLPSPAIVSIVWWHGRFWVGTAAGVSWVRLDGDRPRAAPVNVPGQVVDMDADPDGSLWVMQNRACQDSGQSCRWLGQIDDPEHDPVTVFDERNNYPDLSLSGLQHAAFWNDQLILAGEDGIYTYDSRLHSWNRLFDKKVSAVLELPDGFYFAYTNGVGLVREARLTNTWDFPPAEPIQKLLAGRENEVLVMTRYGNLYALQTATGQYQETYLAGSTELNPASFTGAVAAGDTVLFISPDGALLHNTVTRTYETMPASALPSWFKRSTASVTVQDTVFLLSPRDSTTSDVYALPVSKVVDTGYYYSGEIGDVHPFSLPGPIQRYWQWGIDGLGVLAGDGNVYRLTTSGIDSATGPADPGLSSPLLRDVVTLGQSPIFAAGQELKVYDTNKRTWSVFARPIQEATDHAEGLAISNGDLVVQTATGRLVDQNGNAVIGGQDGFTITDQTLSDALRDGAYLYLAGDGMVERYDMNQREVVDRWRIAGSGNVNLKGIVNDLPVARSGGIATYGDDLLAPNDGEVVSLSVDDDHIWTVRRIDGHLYLYGHANTNPLNAQQATCYFRQPSVGNVTSIKDVRALPDDSLIVATNSGVKWYSPQARSWYVVSNALQADRVYYLNYGSRQGYVILEQRTGGGSNLMLIPYPQGFNIPHSCSADPVTITTRNELSVLAVTINEQNGQVAWITTSGAVDRWQNGSTQPVLAEIGVSPAQADLRRVYDRQADGYLLFTADNALWRYDLSTRGWTLIRLQFPDSGVTPADINVEMQGVRNLVTVRATNDALYYGSFEGTPAAIRFQRMIVPNPRTTFGGTGAAILDVQQRGGIWVFVRDDRLSYFDPVARQWQDSTPLPAPDSSLTLGEASGRSILTAESGGAWWIATAPGSTPTAFARYGRDQTDQRVALDANGTIYRLIVDGRVSLCQPAAGQYGCSAFYSPMLIDPGQVARALEWHNRVLFDTVNGLRVFNPAEGTEQALQPATDFHDVSAAVEMDAGLLLYSANTDRALLVDASFGVNGFDGVLDLVYDESGALWANFADGWKRFQGNTFVPGEANALQPANPSVLPPANDVWATIQGRMVMLPNGQTAYDPVIDLAVDGTGNLTGQRLSGAVFNYQTRAAILPNQIVVSPALDAGWLRWDRSSLNFVVNTNKGPLRLSRDQFVVDNHLLFEPADALLATSGNTLYIANPHGLWRYSQPDLSLNDASIVYYPQTISAPITAAHGRFLSGNQQVRLADAQIEGISDIYFTVGDATFTEQIASRRVAAEVKISGANTPAFAANGFLWDENRRGIALSASTLYLQSNAGFQLVETRPVSFENAAGQLRSNTSGGVYLYSPVANGWYRRDGSNWQNSANPDDNRTLVANMTWNWQLNNGTLSVTLNNPSYDFRLSLNPLSFSSDQLRAAGAYNHVLYVATGAFFETAAPSTQLANLQANRVAFLTTDRLENYHFADGSAGLFNYVNGSVTRLDPANGSFASVVDDPEQQRALILTDRLRFTWQNGGVLKEIRLDNPANEWVTFDLVNGQFPFDYVTAVNVFDNQLYVGTQAGLEVYADAASTSLAKLNALLDFRGSSTGLVAVRDLGVPESDPALFMARSNNACLERRAGQDFTTCADPALADRRLRLKNNFWQWVRDSSGALIGQYIDNAALNPVPLEILRGRFPHDQVRMVTVCNGNAWTVDRQNRISLYGGEYLSLDSATTNMVLNGVVPARFICVPRDIPLLNGAVPRGVYLEMADQQIWHYDSGMWFPWTDSALIAGLLDYANNPAILESGRLRLRQAQSGAAQAYTFEQRTDDNRWLPLPWYQNPITQLWHVIIDQWVNLTIANNQLWVATPLGLNTVARSGSAISVDTANLVTVREPISGGTVCSISDMMQMGDGSTLVRCDQNSALVFQGMLTPTQDQSVFVPYVGDDPFAGRLLVDTGYWQWYLTGHSGGRAGLLRAVLNGEDKQIVGGRFEFDTLTSVALYEAGVIELATLDGGWFQALRDEIPVWAMLRPAAWSEIDPVTAIDKTWNDGQKILCVRTVNNEYVRLTPTKHRDSVTASCPEFAGYDGMWVYAVQDGLLDIIDPDSRGGVAVRSMRSGRFGDDIVVGLPVTGSLDHKTYYWLPTESGVQLLDHELRVVDLYGGMFPSLNQSPAALYMLDEGTPAYLGETAPFDLETRTPLPSVAFTLPPGTYAAQSGPPGLLRARWQQGSQRGWTLLSSQGVGQADNELRLDVSDFRSYRSSRKHWRDTQGELAAAILPDRVVLRLGSTMAQNIRLPSDFVLVEALVIKTKLYLIGQRDLLVIDLDTAIEAAVRS